MFSKTDQHEEPSTNRNSMGSRPAPKTRLSPDPGSSATVKRPEPEAAPAAFGHHRRSERARLRTTARETAISLLAQV
jgi:hypothetical protein